jgi:hypothetical protein
VEIGGKLLTCKICQCCEEPAQGRKSTTTTSATKELLIDSLKINLPLIVMMSAVNPWKPPQPPRCQPVVKKVFCACNVCISDISGKLLAEQAGGIFHPQDPTEYPRHFQSFRTAVG